jgi:hypothetical protein
MKFDTRGIANKLTRGGIADNYSPNFELLHNEFLEIPLYAHNQQTQLLAAGNNIPAWFDPEDDKYSLWVRRPKFARGQIRNHEMHPGAARYQQWYRKKVTNSTTPLEYQLQDDFTPFYELAYNAFDPLAVKTVGNFFVTWDNLPGGNITRVISEWHFRFDDNAEFLRVSNSPAGTEHNLLFRVTELLDRSNNGDWPGVGARNAVGYNPLAHAGIERYFWLRFRRNMVLQPFVPALREMEFHRADYFNINVYQNVEQPQLQNVSQLSSANPSAWMEPVGQRARTSLDMFDARSGFATAAVIGVSEFFISAGQDQFGTPTTVTDQGVAQHEHYHVSSWPMFPDTLTDYSEHDKLVAGASNDPLNAGVAGDLLFQRLNAMFTGNIGTQVPSYSIGHDYSEVTNTRSNATALTPVEIKEPLFGLDSGMSTYSVSNMFYPHFWYDILVQDVDYLFGKTDTNAMFASRSDSVQVNNAATTLGIEFSEATNTKLIIRSRDGLDQRNKLLSRVNKRYPLLYPYYETVDGDTARFKLYYERGVPDYFFIFGETQFTSKGIPITKQNPVISGINFYARLNNNKSLCSYLQADELWNATRRNAHPRSYMTELRQIGGVLLSMFDIGTLEREEYKQNTCLDMDVEVKIDISGLSTLIQAMPIKITLVAVFEDKLVFQGQNGSMSFFEEPREY